MNLHHKINETHLAILRKSSINNNLVAENIPLPFAYEDSMEELRIMSENDNRNAIELEQYIDRTDLIHLKRRFNYCQYLDVAYQELPTYKEINQIDYIKKVTQHQANIDDPNQVNIKFINEQHLRAFVKGERESVYRTFKRRQLAHALDTYYDTMQNDQNVFAHSHRKIGYSYPEFQLGDDFKVGYYTNFGFGGASFFYANISYNGIDIRPYSDWVLYRYAQKADIIRYTRSYHLDNSHWSYALAFTAETFNHSFNDPKTFVNRWIINECQQMVAGLEILLNSDKEYVVKKSFFNPKESVILKDFDLILFKGERTSGALSFLDKISDLKGISDQIDGFISRIMQCNLKVFYQMTGCISDYTERLLVLGDEVLHLDKDISVVESDLSLLLPEKKKIAEELAQPANGVLPKDYEVDLKFIEAFPIVKEHQAKLIKLNKIRSDLGYTISTITRTKQTLGDFCEVIQSHFESIGDTRLETA